MLGGGGGVIRLRGARGCARRGGGCWAPASARQQGPGLDWRELTVSCMDLWADFGQRRATSCPEVKPCRQAQARQSAGRRLVRHRRRRPRRKPRCLLGTEAGLVPGQGCGCRPHASSAEAGQVLGTTLQCTPKVPGLAAAGNLPARDLSEPLRPASVDSAGQMDLVPGSVRGCCLRLPGTWGMCGALLPCPI